jgi:hypothetical protein
MTSNLPLLWQAMEKAHSARTLVVVLNKHLDHYLANNGIRVEQTVDEATGLHSLDVVSDALNIEIPIIIGDAMHRLRSALDTAISTLILSVSGKEGVRDNFPMHETELNLRATFKEGKRTCAKCEFEETSKPGNKRILKYIPDLERLLFEDFRPWRDGNFPLWALSKLDNINKHKMIMPVFPKVSWEGGVFQWHSKNGAQGMSYGSSFSMSPGDRISLLQIDGSIDVFEYGKFTVELGLPPEVPLGGKPVFEVLEELIQLVTGIVQTLETHFKGS